MMGIAISSDRSVDGGMFPLPITIELQCDVPGCDGREAFTDPCGFIAAHAAAMAKGWLERQAPQGRLALWGALHFLAVLS
jgi:hypothetical protein